MYLTKEQKEELQQTRGKLFTYLEELTDKANSISVDFSNGYYIESDSYISDIFHEEADSQTSVYYSEQKEYYLDHSEECERALLEYYDNGSLADIIKREGLEVLICKAGAVGEYQFNLECLYEDKEKIIKIMLINHVLENLELYKKYSDDELIKIIDDSDLEDYETFSEYCEYLENATFQKGENEE